MVSRIIKAILTKPFTILKGIYFNIFNKHQDIADTRLAICNNCPHKLNVLSQDICDLCGCVLENKTRLENEQCEMNKW